MKKASVHAEWDDELESKIEKKVDEWSKSCGKKHFHNYTNAGGGTVYCLGLLGAFIYFISTATSFWDGAFGILQSFVWPAYLVFELLKSLGIQ